MRFVSLVYGFACYLIFLGTILYAIGFVGNFGVPKSIDVGVQSPLAQSLLVNLGLLSLFAIQHSLMARPFFKKAWTRLIPESIERSTYVLFSNLSLILIFWQWRPITETVWSFESSLAIIAFQLVFWLGWGLVFLSTFLINHFELFGLRQVWLNIKNLPTPDPDFRTPFLYRIIRHPLYLGFILAFWGAYSMSFGHLLFAIATTGYILIGIRFEEKDLVEVFGNKYTEYQKRVAMVFPLAK